MTVIETLVALSITSLVLLSLSMGVSFFNNWQRQVASDRQLDWHLFVNQMEYYLENSELVEVHENRLLVKEIDPRTGEKTNAEYKMVNRNFIRRVHGGTQQMLMDVQAVTFTPLKSSIFITGQFYSGEVYQVRIRVGTWYES